jgi:hypothetical protein
LLVAVLMLGVGCAKAPNDAQVASTIQSKLDADSGLQNKQLTVQAANGASGLFITASNFSVSNDDTQITVRDALNAVLFGPAGEGVQPIGAINNREIWKLEANPSAAITPTSGYNDGTSSTFGAPNRWNGGANVQDFSALRAVVPEPAAATLLGVALLGLARLTFARLRLAARSLR